VGAIPTYRKGEGSHFLLRNKTTGKFERITDPDKIEAAMNADEEYYLIYTKDPNVQAFTDLMNRALDKPAQQTRVTGTDDGPIEIRWLDHAE
jgi:hypothetical protein